MPSIQVGERWCTLSLWSEFQNADPLGVSRAAPGLCSKVSCDPDGLDRGAWSQIVSFETKPNYVTSNCPQFCCPRLLSAEVTGVCQHAQLKTQLVILALEFAALQE